MSFAPDEQLLGYAFRDRNLRGATFVECDLSDVVIRGSDISGMEIDAPWLRFGKPLMVNGLDVGPFVEADLNRRFPGRELQEAADPEGLRAALAALEGAWVSLRQRAVSAGAVDRSVAGEWSLAQTMRHLTYAIEKWFTRPVLASEVTTPIGLDHAQVDEGPPPPYAEVEEVFDDRLRRVRDYLVQVTPEGLEQECPDPNDPEGQVSIRACVHVVLEEGWEHLRFVTRDLDQIDGETT